ncbi:hypothetical protein HMSSN139_06450 [Paenibacillus sp. HMSSN-139]|nr:hypothetical protein HMSSN139_06450 [Paenibacillus sp. HMSSN-139]
MGHVKYASNIKEELTKLTNSSEQLGSKFGIGSSLAEITPLLDMPGTGGGCANCFGTACGGGTATELVCASGCGASNVTKVK